MNKTVLAGHVAYGEEQAQFMKYHIVTFMNVGASTVLDGFCLVNGRADDGAVAFGQDGAAILCRNSSPIVAHCFFTHNYATARGGGIFFTSTNPNHTLNVVNCIFHDQTDPDESRNGGAMYIDSAIAMIMNCQFFANKINGNGSAVYNNNATTDIVNSTFWSNFTTSGLGAGVYSTGPSSDLKIFNSIFWRNRIGTQFSTSAQIHVAEGSYTVKHCMIDDGIDNDDVAFGGATNFNIDDDPQFTTAIAPNDFVTTDLRLLDISPCIGRGNCAYVPVDVANLDNDADFTELTPLDLAGIAPESPRFRGRIDMGAFEETTQCVRDTNADHIININDLVSVITGWGPCPASPTLCPGDIAPLDTNYPCGNHSVDIDDLVAIITSWGCGNPTPQSPPQSVLDCMSQYGSEIVKLQACIEAMLRGGTP